MGQPKALLDWQGVPLLFHIVRLLQECGLGPVALAAAPDQELPDLGRDVLVFRDPSAFHGPLTGLATGLSGLIPFADRAFVTACDMPLLQTQLVHFLLKHVGKVVVPRIEGCLQPLLAVCATHLGKMAMDFLKAGGTSPTQFLDSVETVCLAENQVRMVDPALVSFMNCNTPESFTQALAWDKALKTVSTGTF